MFCIMQTCCPTIIFNFQFSIFNLKNFRSEGLNTNPNQTIFTNWERWHAATLICTNNHYATLGHNNFFYIILSSRIGNGGTPCGKTSPSVIKMFFYDVKILTYGCLDFLGTSVDDTAHNVNGIVLHKVLNAL